MGDDQRTIWCGNLPDKVTEALLYELFLQAGPLQRVSIPMDRDGRRRPYAFITYKDECSVPYAISLFEDTKLFNRILFLSAKGNKGSENLDKRINGLSYGNNQSHVNDMSYGKNRSYGNDRHTDMPAPQMTSKDMLSPRMVGMKMPVDFDMLLQLGQQMVVPSMNFINAPSPEMPNLMNSLNFFNTPSPQITNLMNFPVYASQMGGHNYLGGASSNTKNSNYGYQHARNHPYAAVGKGSPSGNHGHDGFRNHSRNNHNKNYHHSGRY